jgi:light-regulated signal transduction histidine kinase (bacteriophytochrome)
LATPSDDNASTDPCAREAIHVPSSIQPHGLFFALTEANLLLAAVSENAAAQLQTTPQQLIGGAIVRFLDDASAERLDAMLRDVLHDATIIVRLRSPASPDEWEASIHRSGEFFLVELEPCQSIDAGKFPFEQVRIGIDRIRQSANVIAACESLAKAIRSISEYDRVLVYRFDARWNGEVIAEDKIADCRTYLHHSFPASDIPAQARALYARTSFRVIPDTGYAPSRIVPAADPTTGKPIDLSDSVLRSVSPIHREYLANMGVVASMSLSVIKDGALWALVACHRHAHGRVSPAVRRGCEQLTQAMVWHLDMDERKSSERAIEAIRKLEAAVLVGSPGDRDFRGVLESVAPALLGQAGAQGLALCQPDDIWTAGITPGALQIREIVNQLSADDSPTLFTDCLADLLPLAGDAAVGMAAVKLPTGWLLWFRAEWRHTVAWAGEPTKSASVSAETGRVVPRKSFETWLQHVHGQSRPWDSGERATVVEAGHLITRLMFQDREAPRHGSF